MSDSYTITVAYRIPKITRMKAIIIMIIEYVGRCRLLLLSLREIAEPTYV
jgi:hypothetical protein